MDSGLVLFWFLDPDPGVFFGSQISEPQPILLKATECNNCLGKK
jgi:hypothetical protein